MMVIDPVTGECSDVCFGRRVRRPYERLRVETVFVGETMTVNSFKDETDINNIVGRYDRSGILPTSDKQGAFADVTGLQGDLTERINKSKAILDKAAENDRLLVEQRKAKADLEEAADTKPGSSSVDPDPSVNEI